MPDELKYCGHETMLVSRMSDFLVPAWQSADKLNLTLDNCYVTRFVGVDGVPVTPQMIELDLWSLEDGSLRARAVYPKSDWYNADAYIAEALAQLPNPLKQPRSPSQPML